MLVARGFDSTKNYARNSATVLGVPLSRPPPAEERLRFIKTDGRDATPQHQASSSLAIIFFSGDLEIWAERVGIFGKYRDRSLLGYARIRKNRI